MSDVRCTAGQGSCAIFCQTAASMAYPILPRWSVRHCRYGTDRHRRSLIRRIVPSSRNLASPPDMVTRHRRDGRHRRRPSGPIPARQCVPAIGVRMEVARGRSIGAPLGSGHLSFSIRMVSNFCIVGEEIDVEVGPWGMRNLDYVE
jgi:hypothetical protein